jgi:hypothetical protein
MALAARPPRRVERPDGRPGRSITTTGPRDGTKVDAILADRSGAVAAELLAWRCRHGECAPRPAHDPMDWWPSWAIPSWR